MGWVDPLKGYVVGLDTAPLIYFIEEHPVYADVVDPFFEAVGRGEIQVVTSVITFLEVLVLPIRSGNVELARKYQDILFNTTGLNTVALSPHVAEEAARLRAFHRIATPDAIQVATAIAVSASYFLTNDLHLPLLSGLRVLRVDELRTS
ncbi:MAG: PIN domain-containing protein [Ktedonobacteraceae bacterium]|nr:PIN domain-containing protein [Ktedonobacteraceae bacterium]